MVEVLGSRTAEWYRFKMERAYSRWHVDCYERTVAISTEFTFGDSSSTNYNLTFLVFGISHLRPDADV